MIKIGITGQNGFIGSHLYNTLGLFRDEFERVPFQKDFFDSVDRLHNFVSECDVIVHLAALNRHRDAKIIYETNIDLVKRLIKALDKCDKKPLVLFSSSSQEDKDNLYGKSKKDGRRLLEEWASRSKGKFTGLLIPNVFGPFGQPNYNSFIATFCHKLIRGEEPIIDADSDVNLIYIGDLATDIISEIRRNQNNAHLVISSRYTYKVSEVLSLLKIYKSNYLENGVIPSFKNSFEIQLFNTFRSYIDNANYFPVKLTKNIDARGAFVEIIRLGTGGQVSFSTTVPGIIRGNHFHTRKIERFAVIKGRALIQLRRIGTDDVIDFELDGDEPAYVDMPIWYTHNIKNIGSVELYTIFWINEFYNPEDTDTFFETV